MQNDRANQLKNLSRLSVVIAAFSMSSFLEFNFDSSTVSNGILITYGITTAAVVSYLPDSTLFNPVCDPS